MEKKKTPAISLVLYMVGILLLVVSAFMLVTALGYTKTYLESYDATFGDMWSNSLQYIIAQFVPYLGLGVICLGIGKAISEMKNVKVEAGDVDMSQLQEIMEQQKEVSARFAERIKYLSEDIDTTREIIGIKISEKERRDAYRLQEMGKGLTAAFETLERKTSEPVVIEVPAAPAVPEMPKIPVHEELIAEVTTPSVAKTRPQIFTMSRRMTMPACAAVVACEAAAPSVAKARPQIFTMSRRMTMPACR